MKKVKPRRRRPTPSGQNGRVAKKRAPDCVLKKIVFIRGDAKSVAVTLLADGILFALLRVKGKILLASAVRERPGAGRTPDVRCGETLLRRMETEARAFFHLDLREAWKRYGSRVVTEFVSPLAERRVAP